jgi:two-component system LytT family sensor kinase
LLYKCNMRRSAIVMMQTGYWLLYLFLLFFIMAGINANSHGAPVTFAQLSRWFILSPFGLFTIGPGILGFYSFYIVLFPRLLKRRKILALILFALLFSLIVSVICDTIIVGLYGVHGLFSDGWNSAVGITIIMSCLALIHGIIGLIMKGFISWYGDIKLKEELNRKNYETELALMKAQINPHFLFNTINNIDVLIEKDPARASEYLNKLSDMMRFMLYETKTEKILLAKELNYIDRYIELQRIRTTNINYVSYEVRGSTGSLLIEPMLFIPFIENAFKHAENKKIENAINVRITIEENKIKFECDNAYSIDNKLMPGGLGNELINRRLALLYPHKHTLEIDNKHGIYKVNLSVTL